MPVRTLTELMRSAGHHHAGVAFDFVSPVERETVLLADILARASRVAGGLSALGVRPRDRVTVQLPNRLEAVVLQFAVLMLDAVLAPIVPVLGAREVGQVLADAGPVVHVTQPQWNKFDYLAVLADQPNGTLPPHVVFVDGRTSHGAPAGAVALETSS